MVYKRKKSTLTKAFEALGRIDKLHESGKITKKQHDKRSQAVLKRLMTGKKK